MSDQEANTPTPAILDQISTRWPMITDPSRFVLRYASAIERYLSALLPDAHAVEEVRQDLLLRVLQQGFVPEQVKRGRFRDYLKAVVRNAALTWWRRERARPAASDLSEFLPDDTVDPIREAEQAWLMQWRSCLLERVWDELELQEQQSPASNCYRVLRLMVEHGESGDSRELAERLSALIGETVRPEAFRKQVSRARRLFAQFLLREVAQTLHERTVERIEEELRDLGVADQVLALLPADWRERDDLLG